MAVPQPTFSAPSADRATMRVRQRSDTVEELAEQHYRRLVGRLLQDRHRHLAPREVVDGEARSWGWFAHWRSLPRILESWLASQALPP